MQCNEMAFDHFNFMTLNLNKPKMQANTLDLF